MSSIEAFLKLTVQDFEEEAKKQIEENGVCKQGAHPKPIPVASFKYSTSWQDLSTQCCRIWIWLVGKSQKTLLPSSEFVTVIAFWRYESPSQY